MTPRTAQRGAALLLLLAVLALGAGWYGVRSLASLQAGYTAAVRERNATVLQQAKQALIGYVALQAVKSGENNPGALPCPEAAGYFDNPDFQGQAAAACSLPKVGRFPWRTVGLDRLVDSASEPLWYVVSPGWARDSGNTIINSNSVGQLTVDGIGGTDGDTVVALIIAPGPAIVVQASSGCVAWSQSRPTTGNPDWRNYLECSNADTPADAAFASTGPSGAFNDQIVRVTKADIMPAIEAAIAQRIEREVVPQLKALYAGSPWMRLSSPATYLSSASPMYPYPAPFANPGTAGSFQGSAASCGGNVCKGLLPVIYTNTPAAATDPSTVCTPSASNVCDPIFTKWASGTVKITGFSVGGTAYTQANTGGLWIPPTWSCSVSTSSTSQLSCTAYVPGASTEASAQVNFEIAGLAEKIGMAMRQFNSSATTGVSVTAGASATSQAVTLTTPHTATLAANGSASTTIKGTTQAPTSATTVANSNCGLGAGVPAGTVCREVTVTVAFSAFFQNHPLVNSQDTTVGWFMRNEWYRVLYYVVAQGHTAASMPGAPACTTTPTATCLSATNVTPAGSQRAFLILAGRSINGTLRSPSASVTLGDYLEFGNALDKYERQTVTPVSGTAYADSGVANAYSIGASAVSVGVPLQFKVANGNTGASTLQTPVTGVRTLANPDGSALAASTLADNGIVQVTFDGTRFQLSRRPFNDRLIVVDAN